MDRATRATLLVLAALLAVHVLATGQPPWELDAPVRDAAGARSASLPAGWVGYLTAPFFHEGLGHLAYNGLLLLAALPIAARTFGPGRAIALSYAASPVAKLAVDALVVLPLAAAGAAGARATAQAPLVGASVAAFAAAGLAVAGALRTRDARPAHVAAVALGVVAYEAVLAAYGYTRPFVWAFHLTGFALAALAAWRMPLAGASAPGRAPRRRPSRG